MPVASRSIPAHAAARLFLGAQGLLLDPARRATKSELARLIDHLGFVQLDTIHVVARAHDLTIYSRLHGYKTAQLQTLLEKDRALFEGFTHDASVVPVAWYAQWKPRFQRDKPRIAAHPWWRNLLGEEYSKVCAHVLERIEKEGPLRSVDFEHPEKRGPWWGWKPQKAALDYLWRIGQLAIARRGNFHKVYDLAGRVYPEPHARAEPDATTHLEWACSTAAERLVIFTPRELAAFWDAIDAIAAKAWCIQAEKEGRLVSIEVESTQDEPPQKTFVVADWESRLKELPETPDIVRLLSPFDPVVRDRARCLRRFGFDYRFEAFTPEDKRTFGYYVLPILEGERIVGRLDPKLHRERDLLEIRGLWWEPGIKATQTRIKRLQRALEGLAEFAGAADITLPPR